MLGTMITLFGPLSFNVWGSLFFQRGAESMGDNYG